MTIMNGESKLRHMVENKGKTMMKWALSIALLLTAGGRTGMADIVDFSGLGTNAVDIGASTTSGNGFVLGNVQFLYDDFGDPLANGTAYISGDGITGFAGSSGLNGLLEFIFNPGATPPIPIAGGLIFHFTLGTATDPLSVADGAMVTLLNALTDTNTFPTDLNGAGTASFLSPSGPYTEAETLFTGDQSAFFFNVSDLAFDVPEPGSIVLVGSLLVMLGFVRRRPAKRRM